MDMINHCLATVTETYKIWYLGKWYGHNSDTTHYLTYKEAEEVALSIKTGDNEVIIAKEISTVVNLKTY